MCKIILHDIDFDPMPSSSLNFVDQYQLGIVISKKEYDIASFLNQSQSVFTRVDPKNDKNSFSRAFYHQNSTAPLIFFGESKKNPNRMYDQSASSCVKSFGDNIQNQIGNADDFHDKLEYFIPAKYILEKDAHQIDLVLFAQLRPDLMSDPNCYTHPEFLVPCLPVKYLDKNLNSDFVETLNLMFNSQEDQGQLYTLSDIDELT